MNDNEAWNKLQFIEDCKMSALTKSPFNSGIEYYPTNKKRNIWNRFIDKLC